MHEFTIKFHGTPKSAENYALSAKELLVLWLFQMSGSSHEVEDPNTGAVVGTIEIEHYDPEYDEVDAKVID